MTNKIFTEECRSPTYYVHQAKETEENCELFKINVSISDFQRTKKVKNAPRLKFRGACIGTGAQMNVTGNKQANVYCRNHGIPFKLRKLYSRLRFGDESYSSLGTMPIRIPANEGTFIYLDVDVLKADVPLLIGLDILDKEGLVAENVDNVLESRLYGWKIAIIRHHGHMYIN